MPKLTRLLVLPLAFVAFVSTLVASQVVRVGYQKSSALLLVRNAGALEKLLAPLGYTVEWREFTSGPPLIEALNAGALDLGDSGNAPAVFAQARGVPFFYIGQSLPSPESAAILVPRGSPLKSIVDLKGKKLAFAKGSSAHFLVAQALAKAGLALGDIKPVYLSPPDAFAALESGSIDAWAAWDPFLAAAQVNAGAQVLAGSAGLESHREFYVARQDFAKEHPGLIKPFLEALNEVGEKALADPKGTAAFLAPRLGIKLEVLELVEGRDRRYTAHPLDAQGITEQQEVADTFLRLGLIPGAIQVRDLIYSPLK